MSPREGPRPTRRVNRGRGHSYYLDDEWTPGVTTVIDLAVPKPALIGWAANTVAGYVFDRLNVRGEVVDAGELIADLRAWNDTRTKPEKLSGNFPRLGLSKVLANVRYAESDAAANRGTDVHRLAEQLARGGDVDVPDELVGHVDRYLEFLDQWRPTNAIVEAVVINRRWRYMGTLDLIADLPAVTLPDGSTFGGRTLLDIKTSRSGVYGETALQLAGYRYAEAILEPDGSETPMEPIDSAGVLWVRADGYDVIPFVADEATFRVFLYARQVAGYLDEKSGAVNRARLEACPPPSPLEEP